MGTKCGLGALAAVMVAAMPGPVARGDLVIDLRLPASVSSEAKHLELTASSPSSIEVNVFARVTGAAGNSTPEAFRSVMGSFKTVNVGGGGALRGSILPFGAQTMPGIAPFIDFGSLRGASLDLDGDGDLDLGSFDADVAADFVSFRTGNPAKQYVAPDPGNGIAGLGTALADGGVEFLIGRLQLSIASVLAGQSEMNYYVRRNADGSVAEETALWHEDGGTKTHLNGVLTAGAPVVFSSQGVPEPGLFLISICVAIGLQRKGRTSMETSVL